MCVGFFYFILYGAQNNFVLTETFKLTSDISVSNIARRDELHHRKEIIIFFFPSFFLLRYERPYHKTLLTKHKFRLELIGLCGFDIVYFFFSSLVWAL